MILVEKACLVIPVMMAYLDALVLLVSPVSVALMAYLARLDWTESQEHLAYLVRWAILELRARTFTGLRDWKGTLASQEPLGSLAALDSQESLARPVCPAILEPQENLVCEEQMDIPANRVFAESMERKVHRRNKKNKAWRCEELQEEKPQLTEVKHFLSLGLIYVGEHFIKAFSATFSLSKKRCFYSLKLMLFLN